MLLGVPSYPSNRDVVTDHWYADTPMTTS